MSLSVLNAAGVISTNPPNRVIPPVTPATRPAPSSVTFTQVDFGRVHRSLFIPVQEQATSILLPHASKITFFLLSRPDRLGYSTEIVLVACPRRSTPLLCNNITGFPEIPDQIHQVTDVTLLHPFRSSSWEGVVPTRLPECQHCAKAFRK